MALQMRKLPSCFGGKCELLRIPLAGTGRTRFW